MKIIEKLCDKIEHELDDAQEYARCALSYKDGRATLAEVFYQIAEDKMKHMLLLHNQVVAIIEEYRKANGEPPESMKTLYEILHKKHIEHAAAVKGMLALYKEL